MTAVSTRKYEASHGRSPRPSQYGMWIFDLERWCERRTAIKTFMKTATYREALRAARIEARMIGGADTIHVCP